MNRDAKDRPIAEASSGINPAYQDGEIVVSKCLSDSAESGVNLWVGLANYLLIGSKGDREK